ncbi:MAG: ABC transporter ATP-binding protein [Burkholderiales bacterium]|nr:MAG: ABC transporter ATP-binding protein [Burkholderiales bacterium]
MTRPLADAASPAIQARGLTVHRYEKWSLGTGHVLQGVDLAIPEGAVVGLVGRNGAGKSTLLRALLGLQTVDEGESRLLGRPSTALDDAVKARLGYAAQTPDLFAGLNGHEHLTEMAAVYPRVDQRLALSLAARLDVPMGRNADTLSLGDQQKLAVVLALAHDPDLVLLDEPVASLDPISRRDFMRLLFTSRQREAPRTVLISSHLLSDLERVVTHVLFLREGRVQLFEGWDDCTEFLRVRPCPERPDVLQSGERHWSAAQGGRLLVDRRHAGPAAQDQALGMEDLMEVLNT